MFKSNRIKAPQAELFSFIFPVNELSLDSAGGPFAKFYVLKKPPDAPETGAPSWI